MKGKNKKLIFSIVLGVVCITLLLLWFSYPWVNFKMKPDSDKGTYISGLY